MPSTRNRMRVFWHVAYALFLILLSDQMVCAQEDAKITLIFPVLGKVQWIDSFNPTGAGGRRMHHGEDLMAPKMRPLVAAFDGTVYVGRSAGMGGHNTLGLQGDNGWSATYMHINNDTPGTNDEMGTAEYAFPVGLQSGDHVIAGQLVAWVGDSGNAEHVAPHCHFELYHNGDCINPAPFLRAAQHISQPRLPAVAADLKPLQGEVRLDGVVRSIDSAGHIAILDLLSWTLPNGKSIPMTFPKRRWVILDDRVTLSHRLDTSTRCSAAELAPGAPITVVGEAKGAAKAVHARLIAFEPPQIREAFNIKRRRVKHRRNGVEDPIQQTPDSVADTQPGNNRSDRSGITQPPPAPVPPSKTALRLLDLVNDFRRGAGLPELTVNLALCQAAQRHSRDMVVSNFCDHMGSDGSGVADRVRATGYTARIAVENFAVGFDTPERVVTAWIGRSHEGHRNMLNAEVKEVGVGVYARVDDSGQIKYGWNMVLAAP